MFRLRTLIVVAALALLLFHAGMLAQSGEENVKAAKGDIKPAAWDGAKTDATLPAQTASRM